MTLPASLQAPRCQCTEIFFGSQENHSTKTLGLANSLTKSYLALTLSKLVLRAKDMNTKLLDGLEIFLGVYVLFLDSSKLQMAGGVSIYRPPSE